MRAELFDYQLPQERIAERPLAERDAARLLVLDTPLAHSSVRELPDWVPDGALVIVNETRVRRARLFGKRRPGGGRVELLLLGPSGTAASEGRVCWRALGRANKPLRPGTIVEVPELTIEILRADSQGIYEIAIACQADVETILERIGHVPIPPYLRRSDEPEDQRRYQTLYARRPGSAAAPTAGLHLSQSLLDRLQTCGRKLLPLELEVGLGTFRPVTVEDLDTHPMHSERFSISEQLAEEVRSARSRGAKVVAIGTTVVRALESAADPERPGEVRALRGTTRLLIQPGYRFKVVDCLFTNFHQPRSTLLALVCAFAGREALLAAYAEALSREYRFLSYGDAMWIPRAAASAARKPET